MGTSNKNNPFNKNEPGEKETIFFIRNTNRFRRKTRILGTLILCFSFVCYPIAPSLCQENLPAVIKKVQSSIVSILILNKEGKVSGQGSGFFINQEGDVIT